MNLLTSSSSATGNPRNKVALKPGRSLMDWVRMCANTNLSGQNGKLRTDITFDELAKHNTKDDAWICINNFVFNVTPYMEYHPGGESELMRGIGKDGTGLFNEVHQWVNYESLMKACLVGKMTSETSRKRLASLSSSKLAVANFLSPFECSSGIKFHSCELRSKVPVTHNTWKFGFSCTQGNFSLVDVPIGKHVRVKLKEVPFSRSYTPVCDTFQIDDGTNTDKTDGIIYFIIKIYSRGSFTPALHKQSIGDCIEISSSEGSFEMSRLEKVTTLILIAAGTGLTPMIRLISLMAPLNSTKLTKLLFFNKTSSDILLKQEMDEFAVQHPRFQIVHLLSEEKLEVGHKRCKEGVMSLDLAKEEIVPVANQDLNEALLICICGPDLFTDLSTKILLECGYVSAQIHEFRG